MPAQLDVPIWNSSETTRSLLTLAREASEVQVPLARLSVLASGRGDRALETTALNELLMRWWAARGERVEVTRQHVPDWFDVAIDGRTEAVWIGGRDPIVASCGCRDYLTSSLGACAHVLAATDFRGGGRDRSPHPHPPFVRWDPFRPSRDDGSWLERVWCEIAHDDERLRELFTIEASGRSWLGGLEDRARREEIVDALIELSTERSMVEPAVRALAHREATCIARSARVSLQVCDRQLGTLSHAPTSDERAAVTALLERGSAVVESPGFGAAIAAAHVLLATGSIERGLVVVPAMHEQACRDHWRRESQEIGLQIISHEDLVLEIAALRVFEPELVAVVCPERSEHLLAALHALAPNWRLVVAADVRGLGEPLLDELVDWIDDQAMAPRWRSVDPATAERRRSPWIALSGVSREMRISVVMTEDQRATHDRLQLMLDHYLGQQPTGDGDSRVANLLHAQRRVCNASELLDPRGETVLDEHEHDVPKLRVLRELLAMHVVGRGERIAVFSEWPEMLELARRGTEDLLGGAGLRSSLLVHRVNDEPDVAVWWASDGWVAARHDKVPTAVCIHLDVPLDAHVRNLRGTALVGPAGVAESYILVAEDSVEARIDASCDALAASRVAQDRGSTRQLAELLGDRRSVRR